MSAEKAQYYYKVKNDVISVDRYFVIVNSNQENTRFFQIEFVKRRDALYLSPNDVEEYLVAGRRKNMNRLLRYENGTQLVITSRRELENYVRNSINGRLQDIFAVYGKVNDGFSQRVYEKSNGELDIRGCYLELSSNDLYHAYKHHQPIEEGDIELSFEDLLYTLEHINDGTIEKAIKRKNGENKITISFQKIGGRIIVVELFSKSAGSIRFKTEWAVGEEKYKQKYKSSSNSTGSINSTNTVRFDPASIDSIS